MLHQTNKIKYYESNQNIFNKSKLPNFIRTSIILVFFNPNNFKILMDKTIFIFGIMACFFIGSLIIALIVATIRYLITGKRFWHPYNE